MKRICSWLLTLALVLGLCACGQSAQAKWQEQYDLGVRYLSEGNYEEAIIAFTAAIDIDPKRPAGFVGRGDAYALSGDTEDNLSAAQADYEAAIALDETLPGAWLGLVDVYIRQGDYDKALETLREALEKTGNDQSIADKLAEMESGTFADSTGRTRRSNHYENGELMQYWLYEYDQVGNNIRTVCYDASGAVKNTEESEFDERGNEIRCVTTQADSGMRRVETYTYDAAGRTVRIDIEDLYNGEGQDDSQYTLITYDDTARTETQTTYEQDGTPISKFVVEYDADGVQQRADRYAVDDSGAFYLEYYVEYIWNEDGSYGGYELTRVENTD